MKKTKRLQKKLNLVRNTVRQLGEKPLSAVGGAATNDASVCGCGAPSLPCSTIPTC